MSRWWVCISHAQCWLRSALIEAFIAVPPMGGSCDYALAEAKRREVLFLGPGILHVNAAIGRGPCVCPSGANAPELAISLHLLSVPM
eukprot:1534364-Rhodomonas_salina.3